MGIVQLFQGRLYILIVLQTPARSNMSALSCPTATISSTGRPSY